MRAVRRLIEEHTWVFTLGVVLALLTAALAPMLHGFIAVGTPWRPGDIEAYDLRPDAEMLSAYQVGHWSAAVAGFLGVLVALAAAAALGWYEGVTLALLALVLAYWNTMPITGDLMW